MCLCIVITLSVNDSHAGLLEGHDLTTHELMLTHGTHELTSLGIDNLAFDTAVLDNFNQPGGEGREVDSDSSYENNTTDGEAREDFDDEFTEDESQRQNFSRNLLLKSFRHKVWIYVMYSQSVYYLLFQRTVSQMSSDSEKDAVSDGPSEKF